MNTSGTTPDRESMRIWLRLVRVAQRIARAGQAALARHDLTPAQFQVLRLVAATPGMTQQAVATELEVTRGNVSQLVSRLETAGLLRREPVGAAHHLTLTPEGARRTAELSGAYDAFIAACFASLDVAERRTLLGLLRQLDRDLPSDQEG